ncbi:MAG: sulfite exporter TauE/SafE family protein [Bacteroidota bacterium]
MNPILEIILVVATGIFCGFVNTLAGSGSVISLPMLMFLGLEPHVANATNRVAIFLQSVTGTYKFYQKGKLDLKLGIKMAAIASAGSIIGANIAVSIDKEMMQKAIGIVMVIMLFVVLVKPEKWLQKELLETKTKLTAFQIIALFGMGIYGGFIQAGVGIFLLSLLVMGMGLDSIKANAIKILITAVYNIFAIGIFIYYGQVNWYYGLILAGGNIAGTQIAMRYGLKLGVNFIRWVVVFMISVSAIVMLFDLF